MEISTQELKQKIENGEKLIVDFWASFCGPCKVMKPTFEKISEEYRNKNSDIQLYTMNVELNQDFAVSLGIRGVPTTKSFKNGEEVNSRVGMLQELQIKELITELSNE
jgi:thioredoxin 1